MFGTFDHKAPGYWLHQAGKDAGLRGRYRWHDLRSTMISWALNDPRSHLDLQSVAAIVGHSDFSTTKHYLTVDLDALREKMETVR